MYDKQMTVYRQGKVIEQMAVFLLVCLFVLTVACTFCSLLSLHLHLLLNGVAMTSAGGGFRLFRPLQIPNKFPKPVGHKEKFHQSSQCNSLCSQI